DPIAFELSGSNDGIDGPYTLIASGDVVDFAQEAEWPRFTKNETEISFENDNAYVHYQLIFTAIRGPVGGSVNSMQIAEVELLGVPLTPVGHWTFDEGAGTVALDSSGNGNDGTLEDGPTVVEGQFGLALAFDGSRVTIPASDSLTANLFQGSFAVSGWINPTRAGNTWQQIFRSVRAAETNDTLFLNNDGRLSWRGRVGGAWAGGMCETDPDVVPADQWTHFAVTGDGTNFRIYVNGDLSQESDFQTTDGENTTYYIGGDTNLGESYAGMIDDVRVYNQALSSAEVSELAGKTGDPSLVIYYSFDEVGDIVADQSGKGHDGVVVGDVTAEAEGMYGGAANFANGGFLDLDGPSIPAEDIPTSAMTLAAWIKIANTGGDHEIFSARASDESWLIHPEPKSSGDIRWLLRSYGGTTIFQIRAGAVTWDEWLHFAGTYDKDSAKAALYINGELIEEMDVDNPADIAGDWGLGARVGKTIDDGRPYTGLMDEFRMYTRALSQDEVLTIMQGM
ncbi:MAG: LamG domain-containing protein, partial [Planctomycetes bacterium]|nr:LamG domain-containing protein [Planctomycetota bacterium]